MVLGDINSPPISKPLVCARSLFLLRLPLPVYPGRHGVDTTGCPATFSQLSTLILARHHPRRPRHHLRGVVLTHCDGDDTLREVDLFKTS
jgi:hypothetical protein